MARYKDSFFADRHARTVYAANTVLGVVLPVLPPVQAAVDIGCGVGTWLSVARGLGAADIAGVDGPWVDTRNLAIPRECFTHHDLGSDLDLGRRFDLAISLEVAEHLPASRAEGFVAWLTRLSDFVLFSAAIPLQGGRNHVNEQWPDYWADLFARQGYRPADFVRRQIWNDPRIATWYRQNLLVFVRRERWPELALAETPGPLAVVHPEVYLQKLERAATFSGALKALRRRWRRR